MGFRHLLWVKFLWKMHRIIMTWKKLNFEVMVKRCTTELNLFNFLGARIWEIVLCYIKKSTSFEKFKLKLTYKSYFCFVCKSILNRFCLLLYFLTQMAKARCICRVLYSHCQKQGFIWVQIYVLGFIALGSWL